MTDGSNLGRSAHDIVAPPATVSLVITDDEALEEHVRALETEGTSVRRV